MIIDTNKDFADIYLRGGDPDATCKELYLWHQALWASNGTNADLFTLTLHSLRGRYWLLLETEDGRTIPLRSDSIVHTWSSDSWRGRLTAGARSEVDNDLPAFYRAACTIGGYVIFPTNRPGKVGATINQARGTRRAIDDRFDLTLECIRRFYDDPTADHPMKDRLSVYSDFFRLFHGFEDYVSHFLLQDLVSDDFTSVTSLVTGRLLHDWETPALPQTAEQYAAYREAAIRFVKARNRRIEQRAGADQ